MRFCSWRSSRWRCSFTDRCSSRRDRVRRAPTLFYAESRDFVARLVERHGADRLRAFLASYVRDPAQWPSAFAQTFGVMFDAALTAFAHGAREDGGL
jgi:hypothetical protein